MESCSDPQVAPAAPGTLWHPRPNIVLSQSRSGSAHCASKHRQALHPRVPPGRGLLGAETPAMGGEDAALPAEAELCAHVPQVRGARRWGQGFWLRCGGLPSEKYLVLEKVMAPVILKYCFNLGTWDSRVYGPKQMSDLAYNRR